MVNQKESQLQTRLEAVEQQMRGVDKDLIERFKTIPKRKLSDMEKQFVFILVEKAKIQRERSVTILNKGSTAFIAFILIAFTSKIYNLIPEMFITILFFLGVLMLIWSTISYQSTMKQEEEILDKLLESFLS